MQDHGDLVGAGATDQLGDGREDSRPRLGEVLALGRRQRQRIVLPLLVPLGEPLGEVLVGDALEHAKIGVGEARHRLGLRLHHGRRELGRLGRRVVGGVVNDRDRAAVEGRDIASDGGTTVDAQRQLTAAVEPALGVPGGLAGPDQRQQDGLSLGGHH